MTKDKVISNAMNKIRKTNNATKLLEALFEIQFPETPRTCFKGCNSFRGLDLTNLEKSFVELKQFLSEIKDQETIVSANRELVERLRKRNDKEIKSVIETSIDFYLDHCTIWAVTTEDLGTLVKVNNIFLEGAEEEVPVYDVMEEYENWRSALGRLSQDREKKEKNVYNNTIQTSAHHREEAFGVYLPDTGSILVFIDRLYLRYLNSNPEIAFQKVLLHEFIHAFLDIIPRVIKIDRMGNRYSQVPVLLEAEEEETLNNGLALFTYEKWGHVSGEIWDFVRLMILSQPTVYRKGLENYYNGLEEFQKSLIFFLKSKFDAELGYKEKMKSPVFAYTVDDPSNYHDESALEIFQKCVDEVKENYFSKWNGYFYECLKDLEIYITQIDSEGSSLRLLLEKPSISYTFGRIVLSLLFKDKFFVEFIFAINQSKIKIHRCLRESLSLDEETISENLLLDMNDFSRYIYQEGTNPNEILNWISNPTGSASRSSLEMF